MGRQTGDQAHRLSPFQILPDPAAQPAIDGIDIEKMGGREKQPAIHHPFQR